MSIFPKWSLVSGVGGGSQPLQHRGCADQATAWEFSLKHSLNLSTKPCFNWLILHNKGDKKLILYLWLIFFCFMIYNKKVQAFISSVVSFYYSVVIHTYSPNTHTGAVRKDGAEIPWGLVAARVYYILWGPFLINLVETTMPFNMVSHPQDL